MRDKLYVTQCRITYMRERITNMNLKNKKILQFIESVVSNMIT